MLIPLCLRRLKVKMQCRKLWEEQREKLERDQ